MNQPITFLASFSLGTILTVMSPALAEMPSNNAATAHALELPLIYTAPDKQLKSFGSSEIARCPDGYKISVKDQTNSLICVPMTTKEYSGDVQ